MANAEAVSANKFALNADGVAIASFSEISGITTEVGVIEHRESTDDGVRIIKCKGESKPNELKFKSALTTDRYMEGWLEFVESGEMSAARKSCSLVMYDSTNTPVARYYLENAWPIKCVISPLRAGGNDIMQQEWTLTFESIQRVL